MPVSGWVGRLLASDDTTPSQNLNPGLLTQVWLAVFRSCVGCEQRRFEPDLRSGSPTISILVLCM